MSSERRRENGASTEGKRGFLARLARDTSGNTLAIVGAALIPLAAMIGSGVDMSRAYMAKTRLQSACDAAALAGRRIMQDDTLDDTVRNEATRFFDFNFPEGLYQTAAFDPVVTRPDSGVIRVTASTTIPTAVMHLFGFDNLPLDVTCDASLDFVNTDVMLVLDTTGSMFRDIDDDPTSDDEERKITALREAVLALYDELKPIQDQLEANEMRLRYGIVPYSTTVNVGAALRSRNPDFIANSWTYPSRVPIYASSSEPVRVGNNLTNSQCNNYRQSRTPANSYPSTEKVVTRPGSGTYRPCDVTTITYTEGSGASFSHWFHRPVVFDTSIFKLADADDDVPLPTRTPGTNTLATVWNGCIEERDTVDTIDSDWDDDPPANAFDLDINLIPTNDATRWRPMWPQVVYLPRTGALTTSQSNSEWFPSNASNDQNACPTEARKLQVWDQRSELVNYVNGLQTRGFTYHDIGMIWGARMISDQGVFGPENPGTFNGMPVARHIIFMTDGTLSTNAGAYAAYGIENIDERITGGSGGANGRHMRRFWMACDAAKAIGEVWVIAFGTALTNDMAQCASSPDQARAADDRDELLERFREIGSQIGALRLTQ